MKKLKTLVLTREPEQTLVFQVDQPCTFAIKRGRTNRLVLFIPDAVNVVRSELVAGGTVAAEMLESIEAKNKGIAA